MSSSSGRGVLLVSAAATVIGVPVVLGSLYNAWQLTVDRSTVGGTAVRTIEVSAPIPERPEIPPEPLPVESPLKERPLEDVLGGLLPEIRMEGTVVADHDPSLPYRLALQGEGGMVLSATVDLGRDGTIDEWWTVRPTLVREVLRDGARVRLVRREGAWVPE